MNFLKTEAFDKPTWFWMLQNKNKCLKTAKNNKMSKFSPGWQKTSFLLFLLSIGIHNYASQRRAKNRVQIYFALYFPMFRIDCIESFRTHLDPLAGKFRWSAKHTLHELRELRVEAIFFHACVCVGSCDCVRQVVGGINL